MFPAMIVVHILNFILSATRRAAGTRNRMMNYSLHRATLRSSVQHCLCGLTDAFGAYGAATPGEILSPKPRI